MRWLPACVWLACRGLGYGLAMHAGLWWTAVGSAAGVLAAFLVGLQVRLQLLGGYGLYYGTTMAATGLLIPALPQAGVPFDAPTPAGQRVAAAFREAIAGTAYYRDYFGELDRLVPADVVLEYAKAACLCQLQTDGAPDRPLLRDVFCCGGDPEEAAQRRASLRFFLDLSTVTDGVPVDQDMFRRLIYFRDLGDGLQYVPRAEVTQTAGPIYLSPDNVALIGAESMRRSRSGGRGSGSS